jgi:hydroxyacylglutathione hydrolase
MEITHIKVGALETGCYILKTGKEALIIDPGGDSQKILENIDGQKATIINTHYHYDHTLANKELREKLNAKILIHEKENDFIDFKADKFLKEGYEIKMGDTKLKVFHTPGHTQGSICLLGKGFAFTGDTLFKDGYGRTDLPGGQPEKIFESLKKLDGILKEGDTIYPGHGEPFTWVT